MREGAGKGKRRKPQRFPAVSTQKSSGSLTAPDKTVTGYDKFSDALKATSTGKNADSADDYVLNLWQSVDCKNEQGYTTTYYYTPANAIFTLNGNNKSSGNTKDSAPCCFLVNRGEVTLNNCTFNDNKVELKGGTTTIEGCTFNSSVTLSGGGGFNDTADVNSGTFKGEVTIQSDYVRIMGGTFEQAVTIKSGKGYTINAGLFQGVVTAESGAVLKIYAGTGGAAYVDAADNTKFKNAEAAAQSTLAGVKVIRHTHSVDETAGTCACGESFGDLAPDNHDGLRRVAKVNATSAADGNIEYWYCSGCGKYYLDAAATKEITYKDTILPAIGLRIVDDVKVWGPGEKPLGVIFHKEYNSFTVQIDGVKSADTGDSFPMGGMTAALFISGGALALMSIRARRKEEEA